MISQRYLDQQRTIAGVIADPEARAAKLAELDKLQAQLDEQRGKLAAAGLRVNAYPGNCVVTGVRVQGGEGYAKKVNGRWLTWSKAGAAQAFGI
jgi:hypothetical protein